MLILAVDPGETTGIVVVRLDGGKFTECHVAQFAQAVKAVLLYTRAHEPDLVIVESFTLRKDKAVQLSGKRMVASEVFGAVAAYCLEHGITVCAQPPAAKDTVSNGLLKRTGLWAATRGLPHARDAAQHILHYCLKNNLLGLGVLECAAQAD